MAGSDRHSPLGCIGADGSLSLYSFFSPVRFGHSRLGRPSRSTSGSGIAAGRWRWEKERKRSRRRQTQVVETEIGRICNSYEGFDGNRSWPSTWNRRTLAAGSQRLTPAKRRSLFCSPAPHQRRNPNPSREAPWVGPTHQLGRRAPPVFQAASYL